jgi:putative endonuclease
MSTKETGIRGEKIAENYLKENGYQILERNYSSKFISGPQRGEIDIIARKKDVISFVEVKTLTQESAISLPERKVDLQKQRKIIKTANFWLMEKKIPLESKWQIDVIALTVNSDIIKLRHLKNAVF